MRQFFSIFIFGMYSLFANPVAIAVPAQVGSQPEKLINPIVSESIGSYLLEQNPSKSIGANGADANIDDEEPYNHDPYGKFNRAIFKLNNSLDKYLLVPVAKTYRFITPGFLRKGVRNFFKNLDETSTIINSVLQARPKHFLIATSRLILNSTLGIGGLFDVAGAMGIKRKELDWGQTLYRWGFKQSSFFVIPFMGPSTVRDFSGRFVGFYYSPSSLLFDEFRDQAIFTAADFISLREELLGVTAFAGTYELQRDLWLSQRETFLSEKTGLDQFEGFGDDEADEDWESDDEDSWENESEDGEEDADGEGFGDEEWLNQFKSLKKDGTFKIVNQSLMLGPNSAFELPAVHLFENKRKGLWLAKEISGYSSNSFFIIPETVQINSNNSQDEELSEVIDLPLESKLDIDLNNQLDNKIYAAHIS